MSTTNPTELPFVQQHWLLWDGDCGLCRRVAAWVRWKDARHRIHTLPYQECPWPPMTPELYAACAKAVHVLTTDGRVLKAGRASLFVLEQIGYERFARIFNRIPFLWFVELGYRIVAHNRNFFSRFLFTKER